MNPENKIRLLHIFPDLMNLYGDYANLLVVSRALTQMGATVEIVRVSPGEKISFSDAALAYIGPGTERMLSRSLALLADCCDEFKAAAKDDMPLMFWGNAAELACAEIRDGQENIPALGLFDSYAVRTQSRQVGDILYKSDLSDALLAGFINKSGFICTEEKPLFSAVFGPGGMIDKDGNELLTEGMAKNNVIASYAIGPALSRNPWLKKIIAAKVFARALPNVSPGEIKQDYSDAGYEITVSELKKRMGAQTTI